MTLIPPSAWLISVDDHVIEPSNVMIETDYPHSDTTWPDCIEVATNLVKHLPVETRRKILRGNAERLFRFTPIEPTVILGW